MQFAIMYGSISQLTRFKRGLMEKIRRILAVYILTVVTFSASPSFSHHTYCVTPTNSKSPELYPFHFYCETFDHYVQESKHYFTSNTTFVLMPGTHLMNAALLIKNVENLQLRGSGTVHCSGSFGFIIVNSSNVRFENITISNCGQCIEPNSNTHAALAFDTVYNLTISGITVHNSRGFGVYSNRVFGSWLIKSSVLKNNSASASSNYSGGNAIIYYENCSKIDTSFETYLDIISSDFIHGHSSAGSPTASGLILWFGCTNISARITNTTFSHNVGLVDSTASTGGNLAIFYRNYTNITVNKVTVENCYISHGHANTGAGMYVSFLETPELKPTAGNFMHRQSQATQILNISSTTFTGNRATHGTVHIVTIEMLGMYSVCGVIIIQNCTFHKNYLSPGKGGVALHIINYYLPGYLQHGTPQFNVSVVNCTFSENSVNNHQHQYQPQTGANGAVMILNTHSVSFSRCIFENNTCSAVAAIRSTIIFQGENTFRNNTDVHGGGLVLGENSQMFLKPHTNITFTGNHAQSVGGGIYVQYENFLSHPSCFFELDFSITMNRTLLDTVAIVMTNNTAEMAGSALYGGSVDNCFLYAPLAWKNFFYFATSEIEVFERIFRISPGDLSSVSSKPTGVCFCNSSNKLDCGRKIHEISKFPGEEFRVSVAVVGQRNGTVPGRVVANFQGKSAFAHTEQYLQKISNTNCNLLNYTVYSNQTSEMITLIPLENDINNDISNDPTYISLSLKPCPLGFTLTHDPPYCDCAPLLLRHQFHCNINDQTILRHSSTWIAVIHKSENDTYGELQLVYEEYCPPGYCMPKTSKVYIKTSTLTLDQDVQCAFNHTGILCGGCKKGFSLVLGSSKCLECSNYYLLLLLVFAVAGIVLVFLLTACNLTVTEGTMNGLIFYCNIVSSNHSLFFTSAPAKSQILSNVPQIFVNWMNLKLGISTCFYNGMTAYAKAWLQFVFPIYMLVIAGAIIFLSRRYTTVARLMGRNAVKVLATLFLISYASLLQCIIIAFSYADLTYSDGSKETIWYYDGNIEYLNKKHIVLFVAAVIVLILLVTYTVILASVQCLRRCNSRMCSWVPRLKPFFDAHTGPYKDNYQFWTGHLLLIRIIILLAYAINIHGHPSVNLLLIISACAHLLLLNVWFARGVYKKWPLDVLESSSFLNLGILSAATAYVLKSEGNQMAVTYTSLSVALVTFIGVLVYHTYRLSVSTQAWRIMSTWLLVRLQPTAERVMEPVITARETEQLLQPTENALFIQGNEPLLHDN